MSDATVPEKIVKTFHRLAIEHGLKKITIDMLARECGISKKTIYKYYDNKKAILDVFAGEIITTLQNEIYKTQLTENNPEKLILKFFDIICHTVQNLPPTIVEDAIMHYPDIATKIISLREQYTIVFLEIIKRGINQKQFREVNPLFLDGFYDAVVNRVFNPEFIVQNNLSVHETLASFKALLLRGLLRDK
jgi:AcrR family transcriptional regulator